MDVRLIARTHFIDTEYEWESFKKMVVFAGKFCTNRVDTMEKMDVQKFDKFIERNVIEREHGNLLEHWSATFEISGISRVLSHQLVRHRHATFHQQSQRYAGVFHSDSPLSNVVVPDSISSNEKAMLAFVKSIKQAHYAYHKLREVGVPQEDARFVAPEAHRTSIIFTANARSLRHILELRYFKPGAQWEIKEMMSQISKILVAITESPTVFGKPDEKNK